MMNGESVFYPFFTLSVNPDGGIMVTMTSIDHHSWQTWGRELPVPALGLSQRVEWGPQSAAKPAPKLHYHRSGFVSVQASGKRRVARQCLPLEDIDKAQIFSVMRRDPADLKAIGIRPNDSYIVSHDGWPAAVWCAGIVYRRDLIPHLEEDIESTQSRGIVRGRIAELCIDLSGHHLDGVLILRFEFLFQSIAGAAKGSVIGFCSRGEEPSQAVGACTSDGYPAPILINEHNYPQFPRAKDQRTRDRRHSDRIPGRGPEYLDWF